VLEFLNDLLWGYVLIYGLVAAGLVFTFGSRLVQFRYFGAMFGILRQAFHHQAGHLSSFQALMLSVAGALAPATLRASRSRSRWAARAPCSGCGSSA
jgi:alanine or glycine:cation symporter, AGCS family